MTENNDSPQNGAAPTDGPSTDPRVKLVDGWDMLPVKLTTDETLVLSKKMADNFAQVTALENQLASYKRQSQADIERLNAEISRSSHLISSGLEYRKVDVETVFDYNRGVKGAWRKDTGESLWVDIPLSQDEKQLELAIGK